MALPFYFFKKLNMNKNIDIKDFIGVYDGYISESACIEAIDLFKHHESFNKVYSRIDEGFTQEEKSDSALMVTPENITELEFTINKLKPLMVGFKEALKKYCDDTNILKYVGENIKLDYLKIQKTLPAQGYHIWHVEKGCSNESNNRVLAFTIYLNDIEDGGETEFLLQSQRVKPVKGRIAIWPAGFPYVHRGNPPLSAEKYIVTSWLSYYNEYYNLPSFLK